MADEPVSMIDASSRAEILDLLDELQAAATLTFLYITHDLASARHFAERIAVMYAGRIVELAPCSRARGSPRHPYTQALLAAVPEPDPANRLRLRPVVAGEPPDPGALPPGCAFHPRCPAFMAGICDVVVPPLIELPPGHLVACHLYPAAPSELTAVGRALGRGRGACVPRPRSRAGAAARVRGPVEGASGDAVRAQAARAASSTSSAARRKGSSASG